MPGPWLCRVLTDTKDKAVSFRVKKFLDGIFEPEQMDGRNLEHVQQGIRQEELR